LQRGILRTVALAVAIVVVAVAVLETECSAVVWIDAIVDIWEAGDQEESWFFAVE